MPTDRTRRALADAMRVGSVEGGIATVASASGSTYQVDVQGGRCTCDDHRYRETQCKHLRRVRLALAGGVGGVGLAAREVA